MKKKFVSIKVLATAVVTLSLACAATGILRADSTPASSSTHSSGYVGTLKVYSDTEQKPDGDDTYRYLHTPYRINSVDGKFTKWINNRDEYPEQITLPKGKYIIQAQSEQYGIIRIPINIKTGRTASLHLERKKDWNQDLSMVPKSNLIRLANGDVVGIYE